MAVVEIAVAFVVVVVVAMSTAAVVVVVVAVLFVQPMMAMPAVTAMSSEGKAMTSC